MLLLLYCPPTVVVFSVNGTRVFSALAAEWQISTFLTKWKLPFGICAWKGGGAGYGSTGWGTAVLKCPSDPPVAMGRARVDFVAQASLTAMTKSFEWPAALWGSEAVEAWHARFPIRRTTRRQTGRQASKQAGDPMGTRSSTITTGIMRVGHESQAKLVGRRHPVGGGAVRIWT